MNHVRARNLARAQAAAAAQADRRHSSEARGFHPRENVTSTLRARFRRLAPAAPAAPAGDSPGASHVIQALAGQRLVVPCRNYTLAGPRASGGGKQAPFNLVVPQITGIALIIWHKDGQLNSPVFAADARGVGNIREARQQVSSELLRGRARLELADFQNRLLSSQAAAPTLQSGGLPALVIEPATVQDAGLYTCTVEFQVAPTQTYLARVNVADPPKNMVVRDELAGRRLFASPAGPFDENAPLALVCEVEPGQPSAGHVSWWQLDSVTPLSGDQIAAAAAQRRQPAAGSARQQQPAARLLQTLDAKADFVSTLSFEPAGGGGDVETALAAAPPAPTATSLAPPPPTDELVFSDSEQERFSAAPAGGGEVNTLQSGDLFLAAHLGAELDVGQLINFVISRMPAVVGGERRGQLRHWRRVQNKTTGSSAEGRLRAHLELKQLNRANLDDEYLCLAASAGAQPALVAPLNASVSLSLNLRPLEVRLESKSNGTFKLGQKVVVECHAIGSRPSAVIKWFRGSQELDTSGASQRGGGGGGQLATSASIGNDENDDDKDDKDDDEQKQHYNDQVSEFNRDISNLTKISYLTFVPQLADNGRQLACAAHNPRLAQTNAHQLSDSLQMNVQFAPRLKLKFGANIRPDAIQLASDIFMDCNIQANPPINDLVWLHNGAPIGANVSAGVIMSNQSLVLRHLQVKHRGSYQCLAHNLLGRSASNKLELRPKFAPICDHARTRAKLELALNQPARIECHVLAEPAEDLHFTWRFNRTSSSGGGQSQSQEGGGDSGALADESQVEEELRQFDTNFTRSSLLFTPRTRRHFGQLLCVAANSMGRQERACAIQLTQSELPEPVLGCFIDNQTHSSFSIHCQPPAVGAGAPGGSSRAGQTYFILELFANDTQLELAGRPHQERRQRQQQQPGDGTHLGLRNFEAERNFHERPMSDAAGVKTAARDGSGTSATFDDEPDEANDTDDDDGLDEEERARLERRRVKRLLSETPSFNVLDLKPNSSYNVLVYVQNSKGRSAPTHHQAYTRPLDASAALASNGRLELLAGRRDERLAGGGGSFARLLSYLPLGAYFSGRPETSSLTSGRHPLASVALVVLLATVSVLTLAFLTSRLLCRSRPRIAPRNLGQTTGNKLGSADGALEEDGDSSRRPAASEMRAPVKALQRRALAASSSSLSRVRPAAAAAGQQQAAPGQSALLDARQSACIGGGAGSGSDTSRETNTTDSTLVSSPRTTAGGTESSSWQSARMGQQQQQQAAMFYDSMQRNNCSRDSLANSLQAVLYSTGSLPKAPPPVGYSRVCRHPDGRRGQQQLYEQQRPERRHTPQISVHSSDCSAAGNISSEQHAFNSDTLDHHHQQRLNQQQQQHHLCEGVYVLNHPHPQQQQAGMVAPLFETGANCLLESDETTGGDLWFGPPAPLQGASAHLNRCHLVEEADDDDNEEEAQARALLEQPACGMPSSFSIPVGLNDRLEVIARPGSLNTRRLSQENLSASALLLKDASGRQYCATGSYLALAAAAAAASAPCDQQLEYCVNSDTPLSSMAGGCVLDGTGQQLQLTPPIDFASDYRRFKQTFGIGQANSAASSPALPPGECLGADGRQPQQQARHRVKFELAAGSAPQAGDQ